MKSTHDEAKQRRVTRMMAGVEELGLEGPTKQFLEAFIMTEHTITKKMLDDSGKNRTALTFFKVEEMIGTDEVQLLSSEWDKAKGHFVTLSKANDLRKIKQEVETERRESAESSVSEALQDRLAEFKRSLEQS